MNTILEKRLKKVRIYDSGDSHLDRYTAVYMDQPEGDGLFSGRGMSEDPFHPQGFGQMTTAMPGRHLGKRMKFEDLSKPCQRLIAQDLQDEEEQPLGLFKISPNTDTVDIDAQCIGASVLYGKTTELHNKRGLHIQIRHNRDKKTFEEANRILRFICSGSEMRDLLEECSDAASLHPELKQRINKLLKKVGSR
jgi:hypothetical protein